MSAPRGIRTTLKGNVDEALRLFAMEAEWAGLNVDETQYVLEEALKCYGSVADASQIRTLFAFYRRYLGMADVARRQALLTRITEFVSEGRQNRYLALLCFLNADTDGQIISGAALDISMVMPIDAGDPLTGPKHVATHGCGGLRAKMGGARSDDEGHAAAGLLLLGDMRLLPMLEEIWERLSPKARVRMVQRRSNLASALAVEFLLRRLEADTEEEYHGELGAFLFNLPEIASKQPINAILDIRRNFGLPKGQEPMELAGKESMEEAFTRIGPRLKALVDRETEPKVLASAYAAWAMAAGVDPEEPDEEPEPDDEDDDDDIERFPDVSSEALREEFLELTSRLEAPPEVMAYCNPYDVRDVTHDEFAHEFSPQRFFPLLVTGIFNPFGPTVCVYGVQESDGSSSNLVNFQLNPFSCTKGMIAMLDEEKVSFDTGEFDIEESRKRISFVARGRTTPSLDVMHEVVTNVVLAQSKLQASFTLCVSSARVPKSKSFERLTAIYQSLPKARQDLDDLRDKKKRNDPWARADMEDIMKRVANPGPDPLPLSADEAKELARLVSSPEQQRIEMANLQGAWEGATDFSPLTPVMTREQLLGALVHLAPDMPNLLNHKGPFYPDDLTRDVPKGQAPIESARPDETQEESKSGKKPSPTADYSGLLGFIQATGIWEIFLFLACTVWALVCAQWLFALALAVFTFAHFFRMAMIAIRFAFSRWLAVFHYALMAWYAYHRIDGAGLVSAESPASLNLFKFMLVWCGVMALLNLGFFTYAKRMEEAPNKAETSPDPAA
jgi:hypothetical protein